MLRELGQCIDAASCAKNVGTGHPQGDTFISAAKPNSSFDIKIAGCAMGATACTSDNTPAGCCEGNVAASIADFTDANLAKYQLIFFANPTGNDFSSAGAAGQTGMAAIQKFILAGGGYAGTHSATDFEQGAGFPFYEQEMTGGRFVTHNGDGTPGTVIIAPNFATHPVVQGIPANWATQDEWYCQTTNIESNAKFQVLATLTGPAQPSGCPVMGQVQRPVFWVREFPAMDGAGVMKGRTFYTIQGHNILRYGEADFRRLMHQAILWATHRLEH
jgi:type 1 glutamine amidotransferase